MIVCTASISNTTEILIPASPWLQLWGLARAVVGLPQPAVDGREEAEAKGQGWLLAVSLDGLWQLSMFMQTNWPGVTSVSRCWFTSGAHVVSRAPVGLPRAHIQWPPLSCHQPGAAGHCSPSRLFSSERSRRGSLSPIGFYCVHSLPIASR